MTDDIHTCDNNEENGASCIDPSPFCDNYKYSNRDMSYTLEKRREEFLRKQKEIREAAFDEKRDLLELFSEDAEDEEVEPMEHESSGKKWRRRRRKRNTFGYRLMHSEWFTEVPEDFSCNWLVKLCPTGSRNLVVAHGGVTTCYYRNGRSAVTFRSKLPGGNSDAPKRFTVLDCIYNKDLNTLFVYDVLAWSSLSLLQVEARLRFNWLQTKFEENPEMREINADRNFCFTLMDVFPAEKCIIQDRVFTPLVMNDREVPYDGILFYHAEGHYVSGKTPLVGWLKLFMIPEILHIDVHPSHLWQKPEDYESIQQYLSARQRKKKPAVDSVEMLEVEEGQCEAEETMEDLSQKGAELD